MARLILAFSFDGLAVSPLEPYGSSWVATPALNRLAASGAVFDRCIVPCDDPRRVLEEIWAAPCETSASGAAWLEAAQNEGLQPTLITDSRPLSETPLAGRFAGVSLVEAAEPDEPCDELEETGFARLMAAVFEELAQIGDDEPACLWVHSDFLTRAWDAPHDLLPEEDLVDEPEEVEENADGVPLDLLESDGLPKVVVPRAPKIFRTTKPPRLSFGERHDPDITLAWMNNYAAQIRLIDVFLGVLLDEIEGRASATIAVTGTSGFALGEHGAIGHRIGPMRTPSIQVPLIVRGPGIPAMRSWHICTPQGLGGLLLNGKLDGGSSLRRHLTPADWKATPDEYEPRVVTHSSDDGTSDGGRILSSGQAADQPNGGVRRATIWTSPAWMSVREHDAEGQERSLLFLKPDDRSDINNVADRLPEVIERMQADEPHPPPAADEK